MADDRNDQSQQGTGGSNAERLRELADKHGGMSPGMTSPDSTQVPLRADTGEPDEDAAGGRSTHPGQPGGTR
jgi:hypothetical protein